MWKHIKRKEDVRSHVRCSLYRSQAYARNRRMKQTN